jgi:hypothetical protein
MASTAIYRSLMQALEGRRVELGLSMATVTDMAGVSDGYYAKMIYPDTPSGRQARWEQVEDVVVALFGRGFTLVIVPDQEQNRVLQSALCSKKDLSANAVNIRHWRHKRHFQTLGSKGGKAFFAGKDKDERSAIMRKRAKKQWRRIREAQRQGEKHKAANAAARAATAERAT